jgi:A/G-specific adenine glycosylase
MTPAMVPLRVTPSFRSFLRRRLLRWFDRNRRDLPWRHDRDPYRVWVSEVMLQQTTVAAVVSRFEPFVAAFPSVAALAAADEQEVLRHWEGLGYYRRARHLHASARRLVAEHCGRLPDDPDLWADLPGVGRYILGAVLSQAFDRRLPILEANSLRVLCRLFGQTARPELASTKAWLWQIAEDALPHKRAGDFNQALMELGALVCTAAKPRCGVCPLARQCVARRHQLQAAIPRKPLRPKTRAIREVAVVVRRAGRVLLLRRPDQGRWSSMWEFPHGAWHADETDTAAALRLLTELTGLTARIGRRLLTLRHSIMRERITMTFLEARYPNGRFESRFHVEGRWLRPDRLDDVPISSPQRKLARILAADPLRHGGSR